MLHWYNGIFKSINARGFLFLGLNFLKSYLYLTYIMSPTPHTHKPEGPRIGAAGPGTD